MPRTTKLLTQDLLAHSVCSQRVVGWAPASPAFDQSPAPARASLLRAPGLPPAGRLTHRLQHSAQHDFSRRPPRAARQQRRRQRRRHSRNGRAGGARRGSPRNSYAHLLRAQPVGQLCAGAFCLEGGGSSLLLIGAVAAGGSACTPDLCAPPASLLAAHPPLPPALPPLPPQWDLCAGVCVSMMLLLALPSSTWEQHWRTQLGAFVVEVGGWVQAERRVMALAAAHRARVAGMQGRQECPRHSSPAAPALVMGAPPPSQWPLPPTLASTLHQVGLRSAPAYLATYALTAYLPHRTPLVAACRVTSALLQRWVAAPTPPTALVWAGWAQFLLFTRTLGFNTMPWLARLPFKVRRVGGRGWRGCSDEGRDVGRRRVGGQRVARVRGGTGCTMAQCVLVQLVHEPSRRGWLARSWVGICGDGASSVVLTAPLSPPCAAA